MVNFRRAGMLLHSLQDVQPRSSGIPEWMNRSCLRSDDYPQLKAAKPQCHRNDPSKCIQWCEAQMGDVEPKDLCLRSNAATSVLYQLGQATISIPGSPYYKIWWFAYVLKNCFLNATWWRANGYKVSNVRLLALIPDSTTYQSVVLGKVS